MTIDWPAVDCHTNVFNIFPFPHLDVFGVDTAHHHFPCCYGNSCTVLCLQNSVGEYSR